MTEYWINAVIVALGAYIVSLIVFKHSRGVCFFGGNVTTDNEKMVRMAEDVSWINWPSRMHDISYGRGQLREYWVFALKLTQMFFRKKLTDDVNIALALAAHFMSSVLIYFVSANYWSPTTGLIIAFLYLSCLWPYQVAFFLGHIHLAQFFFLLAVLFAQFSEKCLLVGQAGMIFLCGLLCVVSFASSSASRKYIPLVLAAVIYALRAYLILPWDEGRALLFARLLLAIVGGGLIIFARIFTMRLLKEFPNKVGGFFTKVFKKSLEEERCVHIAENIVDKFFAVSLSMLIFSALFVARGEFYLMGVAFIFGGVVVAFHLLMPLSRMLSNIVRYYFFLDIGHWASHFQVYQGKEMEVFGRPIPPGFRGEGLVWIHRFFLRTIPLIWPLYLLCATFMLVASVFAVIHGARGEVLAWIMVIFVSLLPTIVVEVTGGLQVGKSYMSSLAGLLFLLAWVYWRGSFDPAWQEFLWRGALVLIALQFFWSAYEFYGDVLPARMGPRNLRDTLRRLGVKKFYTYKNIYNVAFVDAMLYRYKDEFEVVYIDRLREVEKGVVVIPPVTAKSVSLESASETVLRGDFRDDPDLNSLLNGRKIEQLALAKIKTMGVSRYYVHESEVTSFRDLICRRITDDDRWRGYGWVISAQDIQVKNSEMPV